MKFLFLILILILNISCKKENFNNSIDRNIKYGKKEKELIVAQGSKPKSLDPYKFNEFPALIITEHIYNSLLNLDDNGELIPELAESWEYINDREILFNLRKDVKFHNGNTFDSKDVVFSFQRMSKMPGSLSLTSNIKSIEIINSYSIKVKLKEVSAPFLYNLASPLAAIMDEEYSLKNEKNIGIAPNGTGPFISEKWLNGEKFILKANKNYFKGSPIIDKLTFLIITETSNRIIALETDEVQIALGISPFDAEHLKENKNIILETKLTATTDYIALNTKKEDLNNKNLRKAINLAIDKKGIIDSIYFGRGRVAEFIVNPKIWGSIEGKNLVNEYNVELAKELIKDISPIKRTLSLWVSDSPIRYQIAQIIQDNLYQIGIKVEINAVEWGTFLQKTGNGEHDILMSTWYISASDADTILRNLTHSDSMGTAGNRSFYENVEVNNKLDLATKTLDKKQRMEYYSSVQNILKEDVPIIPLIHRYDTMGMSKKIKNFSYNKATLRNLFELIDIEE
ncbi:MAG: ABC transporter substrate-binding protein [Fusobacteriaceae bacterium]